MNRLAIPLSILAVATVTACAMSVREPNIIPPSPRIQPQTTGYQTGTGLVQDVLPSPDARRTDAAAGVSSNAGDANVSGGRIKRLAIRMDRTGALQYIDTDVNFLPGQRVELSANGKIRLL